MQPEDTHKHCHQNSLHPDGWRANRVRNNNRGMHDIRRVDIFKTNYLSNQWNLSLLLMLNTDIKSQLASECFDNNKDNIHPACLDGLF